MPQPRESPCCMTALAKRELTTPTSGGPWWYKNTHCLLALPVENADSRAQDVLWQRTKTPGWVLLSPVSEKTWISQCLPQEKESWQHPTVSTSTLNKEKSHDGNPTYNSKSPLQLINIYIYLINTDILPLKTYQAKERHTSKKLSGF